MITDELVTFIKNELAIGKTREQVRTELLAGGGWKIEDLDEAFLSLNKPVFSVPATSLSNLDTKPKNTIKVLLGVLVLFLLLGAGASAYFFKDKILSIPFVSNLINNTKLDIPILKESEIVLLSKDAKDCGRGELFSFSSDFDFPDENNDVDKCIGESVLNDCQSAYAIIYSGYSEIVDVAKIEIGKNKEQCYFKITDTFSFKGEYNQCPISSVKAFDEDKTTKELIISPPSLDNPQKYAGEIYLYGSGGLPILLGRPENLRKLEGASEKEINLNIKNLLSQEQCSGNLVSLTFKDFFNRRIEGIKSNLIEDIKSTRAYVELYIGQNYDPNIGYKNVCTTVLSETITEMKLNSKIVTCYDHVEGYAISALLSTNEFICTDSEGRASVLKNNIITHKCN